MTLKDVQYEARSDCYIFRFYDGIGDSNFVHKISRQYLWGLEQIATKGCIEQPEIDLPEPKTNFINAHEGLEV